MARKLGIPYNTAESPRYSGCRKLDIHPNAVLLHAMKAKGWT